MSRHQTAREWLCEHGYEDAIVFENPSYDTAFVGVTSEGRAVYDYSKMMDELMQRDGMTEAEAIEWLDYNTLRAMDYIKNGPVVIDWMCDEE